MVFSNGLQGSERGRGEEGRVELWMWLKCEESEEAEGVLSERVGPIRMEL